MHLFILNLDINILLGIKMVKLKMDGKTLFDLEKILSSLVPVESLSRYVLIY